MDYIDTIWWNQEKDSGFTFSTSTITLKGKFWGGYDGKSYSYKVDVKIIVYEKNTQDPVYTFAKIGKKLVLKNCKCIFFERKIG